MSVVLAPRKRSLRLVFARAAHLRPFSDVPHAASYLQPPLLEGPHARALLHPRAFHADVGSAHSHAPGILRGGWRICHTYSFPRDTFLPCSDPTTHHSKMKWMVPSLTRACSILPRPDRPATFHERPREGQVRREPAVALALLRQAPVKNEARGLLGWGHSPTLGSTSRKAGGRYGDAVLAPSGTVPLKGYRSRLVAPCRPAAWVGLQPTGVP